MTTETQAIAALVAALTRALDSHAPKREAALRARERRLEKMGSDLNDGLMPILDSQGRLHAPCDGYAWTWEVEGHINREPFLAGEFLPCDSKHEATRRFRVKGARRHECIPLGLADAVQDACTVLREHEVPFDLSSGQPFESRQWGEEVAHVYAETPNAEAHEILAAFFDAQVYAQRRAEIEEREKAERRDPRQGAEDGRRDGPRPCNEPAFYPKPGRGGNDDRPGDESEAESIAAVLGVQVTCPPSNSSGDRAHQVRESDPHGPDTSTDPHDRPGEEPGRGRPGRTLLRLAARGGSLRGGARCARPARGFSGSPTRRSRRRTGRRTGTGRAACRTRTGRTWGSGRTRRHAGRLAPESTQSR